MRIPAVVVDLGHSTQLSERQHVHACNTNTSRQIRIFIDQKRRGSTGDVDRHVGQHVDDALEPAAERSYLEPDVGERARRERADLMESVWNSMLMSRCLACPHHTHTRRVSPERLRAGAWREEKRAHL